METKHHEQTISPSKITEYFGSRKVRRRKGENKQKEEKKDFDLSSSVYLTPEASPESVTTDLDDPIKSHEVFSRIDNRNLSEYTLPAEIVADLQSSVKAKQTIQTCESLKENSPERAEGTVTPLAIEKSPSKCKPEESNKSEKKKSHIITTIDSPSVPRTKVRKGSKSETDTKTSKTSKPRKKKDPPQQTNIITDYFPVRRSGRQTKSELALEKQMLLERLIISNCQDGLKIEEFPEKGRGIVATKDFDAGDFVVQYSGDLLDIQTAKTKELKYAENPTIGCYMYFFKCGDKSYCVDATAETDHLGRLINHSRHGNCMTKSLLVKEIPRLILVAKRDIKKGEELSYDYGDRSKEALEAHPWLKL